MVASFSAVVMTSSQAAQLIPYWQDESVQLFHADCLDVLRALPDNSVDSVVTDPPYGLEFMGKEWDAPWKSDDSSVHAEARSRRAAEMTEENKRRYIAAGVNKFQAGRPFQQWCEQWAYECLRVLKPGGHLLAFGGTRTWHRLACAVEDAGFEIRDSIAWLYGSGFPKSLDVSKAIDASILHGGSNSRNIKAANNSRPGAARVRSSTTNNGVMGAPKTGEKVTRDEPATDDARRWQGWGTALKPAFEPVVVARKPLVGTVAQNVTTWGTGALNVDACRISGPKPDTTRGASSKASSMVGTLGAQGRIEDDGRGRWPANVVLSDDQAAELDRQSGTLTSPAPYTRSVEANNRDAFGANAGRKPAGHEQDGYGDSGGGSRFFPTFRSDGVGDVLRLCHHPAYESGCQDCETRRIAASEHLLGLADGIEKALPTFRYEPKAPTHERPRVDGEAHATVKPLDLMRWLVRLVTPPGGLVLEPFAGSGTTAEACIVEGFRCVAIEREAAYLPLIVARLSKPIQPDLFGGVA